jgi:aminoglycoside 6'-N-acetyltransferase I
LDASATILVAGPGDEALLSNVAPGVFDHAVDATLASQFLADPRHHLLVAVLDDQVVGFLSAVHYVNPDKPAELWINEVGVSPAHQKAGIGRRLLEGALKLGRNLACVNAWVLTDRDNVAALRLYRAAGGEESSVAPVMFEFDLGSGGGA